MRIALAALALLALAGCGTDTSPSNAEPTSTIESSTVPISAGKALEPVVFEIGRTGATKGAEFTIHSVKVTSHALPGMSAPSGEEFVIVIYTLKNTSDVPFEMMTTPELNLVDGKEQVYAPDTSTAISVISSGDYSSALDLNPGTSARTVGVWKVSKERFDLNTWKLLSQTDPVMAFKLK